MLKQTYLIYQDILYSFKDYDKLKEALNNINPRISNYMKTSIKTLLEFLPYINTFENEFHNGFIEDNNNFIKVY